MLCEGGRPDSGQRGDPSGGRVTRLEFPRGAHGGADAAFVYRGYGDAHFSEWEGEGRGLCHFGDPADGGRHV